MAWQGGPVNFVALLNGLAEELAMPQPTYHPDQPPAVGLHAAICRFGVASVSGSGDSIQSARNAAACLMWSRLGNGVRAAPGYALCVDLNNRNAICAPPPVKYYISCLVIFFFDST
jgi:hypothetical protein